MSDDSVFMEMWMLVGMHFGDRKLDFYAVQESYATRVNPSSSLLFRKHHVGVISGLLEDKFLGAKPVYVTPMARPFVYIDQNGEEDDFADNEDGEPGEYDIRHPGTHWESDDEDSRGDNERFSPIATKAGQTLGSILFAGPAGTPSCELKSAYSLQLSVRVDEKRLAIIYDCFEFKGSAMLPSDALPTNRSIRRFETALNMNDHADDDDDEEDDDEDDPVEPTRELNDNWRAALHMQGHVGDFLSSRVLRFRVSLSSICGARVHAPGVTAGGQALDGARALLVLEFDTPPSPTAFAARKVGSRHQGETEFATVRDWTSGGAASAATRHYISGGAVEIQRLAEHLASLSVSLKSMLGRPVPAGTGATENSLGLSASLALAAAPTFSYYGSVGDAEEQKCGVPSLRSLSASGAVVAGISADDAKGAGYPPMAISALQQAESKAAKEAKTKGKLTCEQVHELMVERLGITAEEAERANPCFKRGVLLGFIQLGEKSSLQDVICEGSCFGCSSHQSATIADVLDQLTYGGNDYEDGGQNGAVQCEECEDCGMYVTGLCQGRPSFDSGKFHNHCTSCPDFGQCIGDYREAHCEDCGKHWFCGLSGFACTNCGGGRGNGRKSTPLDELPPPPMSAFDGEIEGAAAKVREMLSNPTVNPLQRMLMMSLLSGLQGDPEREDDDDNVDGVDDDGGLAPDLRDDFARMLAAIAGNPDLTNPTGNGELLRMLMGAMGGEGANDEEEDCQLEDIEDPD